jgi:hypothetical protein
MPSKNHSAERTDFAGILALSSRAAGYAVAQKCLEVQAAAEARDPSLRTTKRVILHDDAWSWCQGALGEIEVGRMLSELGPEWFVRHAVPIGAGTKDVDHLVIGPGGVFAINTKHHSGAKVWVGDRVLGVSTAKTRHLADGRRDGLDVATRLCARVEFPVPVRPVIALVDPHSVVDRRDVHNRAVAVLDARKLVAWLRAQPQQLSDTKLSLLKLAAEEPQTWHVDPQAANTLRVMPRFERLIADVGIQRVGVQRRPAATTTAEPPRMPSPKTSGPTRTAPAAGKRSGRPKKGGSAGPRQPGPRDWAPPTLAPAHPSRRDRGYAAPARRSPTRGAGLGSLLFGAVAAAMIFAQPGNFSAGNGYLFSTVGLTGIALGFTALRNRPNGRVSNMLLPTLGITLGALGTLVMVLNLVNFSQHPAAAPVGQPISVAAPSPAKPAPTVAVTRDQDRMDLARSAGTLAYLLKQVHAQYGGFPATLSPGVDGLVATTSGGVKLPHGASLAYQPREGNQSYALTITGATGAVAYFDTMSGVVETR